MCGCCLPVDCSLFWLAFFQLRGLVKGKAVYRHATVEILLGCCLPFDCFSVLGWRSLEPGGQSKARLSTGMPSTRLSTVSPLPQLRLPLSVHYIVAQWQEHAMELLMLPPPSPPPSPTSFGSKHLLLCWSALHPFSDQLATLLVKNGKKNGKKSGPNTN